MTKRTNLFIACGWVVSATIGSLGLAHADELVILPERITVRADYPAQVVVLRVTGEQVVDETRHASFTIPASNDLTINAQGRISLSGTSSDQARMAQLHVQVDQLSATAAVNITPGPAPSPIFPREVAAVLGKAGCNLGTCHGNLHGKAGFRLSLRGDDPRLDYTAIVRGQGSRLVDRFTPDSSLLLRKPLGLVAHQGGMRFEAGSVSAEILRRWISEGCHWTPPRADGASPQTETSVADGASLRSETLDSLEVFPSVALLASTCHEQQLSVIATFADGVRRDVTQFARFEPSLPTGIEVSELGLVKADKPMDVSISVSYLSGRAASRLTFLPHAKPAFAETKTSSQIDQLVNQQLQRLQVKPEPPIDDFGFVRRAHLAIAGRLPSADEVRQYCLTDQSPDKREKLVERLLNEPGYAWLWAMRWSDLLRNEQKVMSDQGAAGWHAWMSDQVAIDRPLDQFVAEMITTVGSTYEHPPASFHRTHRDPETAAESIGQVFLGVRLQCARCHNHPFDRWRQDDYYGLAAYFTTLERKQINNEPKDKFDKHIISGDEVISLKEASAHIWHPGRATDVQPKPLAVAYRSHVENAFEAKAPLEALARWLTVDNRLFARNMANRIWYHYMGVGIVDPPDDFRDSNPACNPELLEYLTNELIRSGYSTRHVARLIVTSETFARQSASEPDSNAPLGGARVFSGYPLRRLPAEILLDAISTVTDVYPSDAKTRQEAMATAQVQVPTKANFLSTFGKPGRLLVCECERSSEVSLGQSLVLINGTETRDKLSAKGNIIDSLINRLGDHQSRINELFLTVLARQPTQAELNHFSDYITHATSPRPALEDILWALMNSKEFSLLR